MPAMKNVNRFRQIQVDISENISTYYSEREALSRLTDAKSVSNRQGKVDACISNVSTLNAELGALIDETHTPPPPKAQTPPPADKTTTDETVSEKGDE